MAQNNVDVLVSGKTSFKIEVPYKLIEVGEKNKKKPLLVYFHGYGENIKQFEKKCEKLLTIEAYHLFIQGPYPIYDRKKAKNVADWGRAWYLYDGNGGQFIKSLEITSEFIQEIIDRLLKNITPSRIGVVGYSMGGYLAGYFALTRWKHVNELIVCGARIKTEILDENWSNIKHMRILAVHGENDDKVKFKPQQNEIEELKKQGVNAEFVLLNEVHTFNSAYIQEIFSWLKRVGYKEQEKSNF
ncbi:MAG: dienelactone hydrolase family protein [Balneolaceae bacterium]